MITVTTREQPATRGPMELSHRHAQMGVLEHRAKRLFCDYTTSWGELGAARVKLVARDPRRTGALARFLVEAHLSHQSALLFIETDTDDERQTILGLGLPPCVFQKTLS